MSGGSKKSAPDIPTEGTYTANPVTVYRRLVGRYPSNCQIWWAYKRPLELGTQEPPKNYIEVFDPQLRLQISTGNTQAPKGHYIMNALHLDRSAVSGIGGLEVKTSGAHRPTSTAFFAGRVFFGGVNTVGFNTKIYFSQILERKEQIQYCFQQNDPTSEDLRDLLPSDGGVIVIPELQEVRAMFVYGQALFVGASNGIWMISGSEGIGFRANDYSVTKLSSTPILSNISLVFVEGQPMWWNRSGIWTIQPSGQGMPQVVCMTDGSIKQFYDAIPSTSKFYAKGAYDSRLRRVQWLYRSTDAETDNENFQYDRILNLDTQMGAFWPYTMERGERVQLLGIFDIEGYSVTQEQEEVLVYDDVVMVDDDGVLYLKEFREPVQSKFKYIVNVLDDSVGVPPPPEPGPYPQELVFVNAEQVLVNSVEVIIQL